MEKYIEGTGSNIGSENCEDEIVVPSLANLHEGEMEKNQRHDFLDYEQHPSDDDISSCVEIPFDRVAPLKFALQQFSSNRFDLTIPKDYFDGGFVFPPFYKMLHLK